MATTYDAWYYTDGSAINGLDDPYEIGEVAWNACEALKPSPNTASPKCAEEIMRSLSGRSGIDLYQYDSDIVDDIRQGIVDIISAHIGRG